MAQRTNQEQTEHSGVRLTEQDVKFDDKGRAVIEKKEASDFMREALARRGEVFVCEALATNSGCVNIVCRPPKDKPTA